jgi:hypothetical protein
VFAGKVKARLGQAFHPGTVNMQNLAFKTLAMFCILFSAQFPNISVIILLSYIEFLADNKYAASTVKNYVSACKTKYKQLQLNVTVCNSASRKRLKYHINTI